MTFPSSVIKADISDDDKFLNFSDNVNIYDVNSGELITDPTIPLDNTTWSGSIVKSGASQPLQLVFTPGARVRATTGALGYTTVQYSRSASGAVIRFTATSADFTIISLFCVVTSAASMKGTELLNKPLQLTKQ